MSQGPRHSTWSQPDTVSSFAGSPPNEVLLEYAGHELATRPGGTLLDLGCGAARNAVPLAQSGWTVAGIDTAWPMLAAARDRAAAEQVDDRVRVCCAAMDALPFAAASFDLVVAQGIWNLARSGREFRDAVREAARVAKPGAGLFLFTFSRHTLTPAAQPVAGETFVFTDFSGDPQCFLTEAQVLEALRVSGFDQDTPGPLTEYNRPPAGPTLVRSGPVIYEGTFRRR
jgi:SAM-dependent methyltransferase